MRNTLCEINSMLDNAEGKISKLKHLALEAIQNET